MPEEILATFSVRRLAILAENGEADEALLPALDEAGYKRMYELMVQTRTFDERALLLQREGRLGTYPPNRGQEACQVGSALALDPADWVVPSFREMGVHLTMGYPMPKLFLYWAGDERGLHPETPLNILPVCVSVGSHIPHAVGLAMAARYRRDPVVVAAYFGDGATSKGDFHEALNMAGVFRAPVVFICQNNQWAISVPLSEQTAAASLAQKAVGYGFEGIQVDGNDVLAVYRATAEALERARRGDGPTLIECLTYRVADHTTADDAGRYRSPEEVAVWQAKDPILRLERFLTRRGWWNPEYAKQVHAEAAASVDGAVTAMEQFPPPEPADMFAHTLETPTPRQIQQQKEL